MRVNRPYTILVAFEEGIEARSKNKELNKNPYKNWDTRHNEWNRGWKLENWRISPARKVMKDTERYKVMGA